jgi:hypothetical protein
VPRLWVCGKRQGGRSLGGWVRVLNDTCVLKYEKRSRSWPGVNNTGTGICGMKRSSSWRDHARLLEPRCHRFGRGREMFNLLDCCRSLSQSVTQFSERRVLRYTRLPAVRSIQIVLPPSGFARARYSSWPRPLVDSESTPRPEHHPEDLP